MVQKTGREYLKDAKRHRALERLKRLVAWVLILSGGYYFLIALVAILKGKATSQAPFVLVIGACVLGLGLFLRSFDPIGWRSNRVEKHLRMRHEIQQERDAQRQFMEMQGQAATQPSDDVQSAYGTVSVPGAAGLSEQLRDKFFEQAVHGLPKHASAPTIDQLIQQYGIDNQDELPSSGAPSVFLAQADPQAIEKAQRNRQLFGNPGSGLESSGFGTDRIASGEKGEKNLAAIIMSLGLPIYSFWSVQGINSKQERIDADIDCIIVGRDVQGKVRVLFIDAKNYAGGSDTMYANVYSDNDSGLPPSRIDDDDPSDLMGSTPGVPLRLVGIDTARHRFRVNGNGGIARKLSGNMSYQRYTWCHEFDPLIEDDVAVDFLVTLVPNANHGAPRFARDTYWPESAFGYVVRAVDIDDLVQLLRDAFGGSDFNGIPMDLVNRIGLRVKNWTFTPIYQVPTPLPPTITARSDRPGEPGPSSSGGVAPTGSGIDNQ